MALPLFFNIKVDLQRFGKKNRFKISFMILSFSDEGFRFCGILLKWKFHKKKKTQKDKTDEEVKDKLAEKKKIKQKKKADKKDKDTQKESQSLSDILNTVNYFWNKRGIAYRILWIFFNFLYKLITDIKVEFGVFKIWIGAYDPALTGMICGVLYSLNNIVVYPDFSKPIFNVNGQIIFRFRIIKIFWRLLILLWQLPKYELFKIAKDVKGGNYAQSNRRDSKHSAGKN